MKILYAIQGTGNGHVSRAREIVPILKKYADVDVLLSGTHSEVEVGFPITYRFHGLGFKFGKNGNIDILKTLKDIKPFRFIKDVYQLTVKDYDLVISDVEPISAWACKLRNKKCLELSHQICLSSPKTPKVKGWYFSSLFLKYYTPRTHKIGFHFKKYDDFIYTPVIRKEVRDLIPNTKNHFTVYLPAYSDEFIFKQIKDFNTFEWHVFSKNSKYNYQKDNVFFKKINSKQFLKSLENCKGLLTGGGFEGPSEALFLKKKLIVVPMKNQYEQLCNAKALEDIGTPVIWNEKQFGSKLKKWIENEQKIDIEFPNETENIIENIISDFKNK